MQVYKYTVHGQNSLVMEKKLTKKPRKHANSVSFKNHSMKWHQRRVLLLVTARFTFGVKTKKQTSHYCSDKETRKTNQLQKSWSMRTSPGQQLLRECRCTSEMNNPQKGTSVEKDLPFQISPMKTQDRAHLWNKTAAITCKADTWVTQDTPAAMALLNYIYMWLE